MRQRQRQYLQERFLGIAPASPEQISWLISPSRMAIPIRKVRLSQDVMSKPIPMLSDRQFVVAQSGLTKEEEKAQQELFWYREELLKSVQAKWHEVCYAAQ